MINLTGQKFGKLTALKYTDRNKNGDSRWLCLCDCGQQKIINNSDLQTGNTKSCGCLRIKHGHTRNNHISQIYSVWLHMIQRCNNEKNNSYPSYGGRGIAVCKYWLIFENFLKDMDEPPTSKHSIDRIDNNKGYCKSNCRWSTRKQQQGNMRSNRTITFNNKTQCIAEWSRKTGINQKTLWHRIITLKWPPGKALTTSVQKQRRKKK